MIITNKLDRSFGKSTFFPGIIFLVSGSLLIFLIWPAIMALAGAFILFTHDGVQLDTEKREVRPYQSLFGIFKTGKWIPLDRFIGLTLVPVKRVSKIMSMSNRSTSIEENDFRIFLVNPHRKPDFPIKKCKTADDAQDRLDELSLWLKMPVYSPVGKILN